LFVISSLQTSLYQINECIHNCLDTIDRLGVGCAGIQHKSHLYCTNSTLNLGNQENYACIVDDGSGHRVIQKSDNVQEHLLKQKGNVWHSVRKTAKVTGSTAYKALGLDGLKKQVNHFDVVVNKKVPTPVSAMVQQMMEYGTDNEINAVATLVGKCCRYFTRALALWRKDATP
jgi:hypothetical protein